MRMHRGSSNSGRGATPPQEILPLSATPLTISVDLEVARAGHHETFRRTVPSGTTVRTLLRSIGRSPEGCAVLLGDRSVPMDLPLDASVVLLVVPTFSGG